MKKVFLILIGVLLFGSMAYADDLAPAVSLPSQFNVKQGMLMKWRDPQGGLKNLSAVTIAQTHADAAFGGWNALWDGWSVDFGWAYDGAGTNTTALMLGREVGTLGKYLPIDFPLKDKINITIYPVGIIADDITNNVSVKGASGLGLIKFDVAW